MEKQHNLIVAEDTNGEIGLMIAGSENNEKIDSCRIPLLITHDCLEHMGGLEALGTSTDEFQALGAIHYGRGFGEHLLLRTDIQNTWRYMNQNEETLEDVGEVECEEREYFQLEVDEAWNKMARWADDEDIPHMGIEAKRLTVNLMCLGYNKANERFYDRLSAYDAYTRVEEAFINWMRPYTGRGLVTARYMPDLNLKPVLGQRLKLTYTTDGQSATLEEIYE